MNLRLQQFINAENITQSELADSIGVARGSISHILSGRNKPSFDMIEKMAAHFPSLNVEGLITGKGKMYKNHPTVVQEGDLFDSVEDENEVVSEEEIAESMAEMTPSKLVQPRSSTLSRRAQSQKNQRVISRILVFFSDGTFQELVQDNA